MRPPHVTGPYPAQHKGALTSRCDFCVSRYSIERSSDPEKFFYVEITTGSLVTVRLLDREAIGWHNITVLAMEMSTSG